MSDETNGCMWLWGPIATKNALHFSTASTSTSSTSTTAVHCYLGTTAAVMATAP